MIPPVMIDFMEALYHGCVSMSNVREPDNAMLVIYYAIEPELRPISVVVVYCHERAEEC
jgi:hypothetical protein